MSDEEFCDPEGAKKRWHKPPVFNQALEKHMNNIKNAKLAPRNTLFAWKRQALSLPDSFIINEEKRRKVVNDSKPNSSNHNVTICEGNSLITKNQIVKEQDDCKIKNEVSNLDLPSDEKENNVVKNEDNAKLEDKVPHLDLTLDENKKETKAGFESGVVEISDDESEKSVKSSPLKDQKQAVVKNEKPTDDQAFIEKINSLLKQVPKPRCADVSSSGKPPIMIAGVPVRFPVAPYRSQISVMNAVSNFQEN